MDYTFRQKPRLRDQLRRVGFVACEFPSAYSITDCCILNRFYKISLISGKGSVESGGGLGELNGCVLAVTAPMASISWQISPGHYRSYTCIFSDTFMEGSEELRLLRDKNLFDGRGRSMFNVSDPIGAFSERIYRRMLVDQRTIYPFRDDLIRSQISLLVHEALKGVPASATTAGVHRYPFGSRIAGLTEWRFPLYGQVVHWN